MDDTAILFTVDHGFLLGEQGRIGKHTVLEPKKGWPLYEEIAKIPLLVWVPGMKRRRDFGALVQPVDMMPTILDLAGAPVPGNLHGRSFLPIIRGKQKRIREYAVSSGKLGEELGAIRYSGVTDGVWSFHCAGGEGESFLYHLPSDPKQRKNVIGKEKDAARKLHTWYMELLASIGASEKMIETRSRY